MGSRAERNELVSSENFNEVLNQHKGLLYPAYRLQIQMRQKFFGRKYWENKIIQKVVIVVIIFIIIYCIVP